MNADRTSRFLCTALAAGMCLLATAPALADAWAESLGSLDGEVLLDWPGTDQLMWNNASPENWLLHAEGEVYHMHPPLTHDWDADTEEWDAAGDGIASLSSVSTGDLAMVEQVSALVNLSGGPSVDIGSVFSSAHDIPNSWSAAAGLAQHDNLFWIIYDGQGEAPDYTTVTVTLDGWWHLEGDSDPDDDWWADIFLYGEVYDELGIVLDSASEYHGLDGPGYDMDEGSTSLQFSLLLEYDTPYALRFWVDAESYAIAVPEPSSLALLIFGALALARPNTRD